MKKLLVIKDLYSYVGDSEIVKGINLELEEGKIYVIMGPNGSGKSTLAKAIMGNKKYDTKGKIFFMGEEITDMKVDERAKKGIFMSFQQPQEISGVSVYNFLRRAHKNIFGNSSILEQREMIKEKTNNIGLNESFLSRYMNEGFSGGEKKKSEILQMLVLNPKLIILDEIDSGLDVDSLRSVAGEIKNFVDDKKEKKTFVIITHYRRILDYLDVDKVFIMKDGKIVRGGGKKLIYDIEDKGYDKI